MGTKDAVVYLGLIHSPVLNKLGKEITTTVTNKDLHDIARASKTYNLKGYFVINPLKSQQELVKRMLNYWTSGYGADYNSNRHEAFSVLRIASDLDEVLEKIEAEQNSKPYLVATSARTFPNSVSYQEMRGIMAEAKRPFLLLLGTGWGLTDATIAKCDYLLAPIYGRGDFNHLSVRSAASIILDRLLAAPWWK